MFSPIKTIACFRNPTVCFCLIPEAFRDLCLIMRFISLDLPFQKPRKSKTMVGMVLFLTCFVSCLFLTDSCGADEK